MRAVFQRDLSLMCTLSLMRAVLQQIHLDVSALCHLSTALATVASFLSTFSPF